MDSGIKRAVLVHHRRAGKDLACFNYLIKSAYNRVGNYWHMFPEYSQARKAIWEGKTNTGVSYLDFVPKQIIKRISNSELIIELKNKSIIRLVGSDSDSLVGSGPCGVVFSEYALITPEVWGKIEPMLVEQKGFAIFNGTPRGENHFFDMYNMAKDNPKWFASKLGINDTGMVSTEELEELRSEGTKTEEDIQQEYFCSFTGSITGSYYSHEMDYLTDNNHLTTIEYEPALEVHTAWDIGVRDSTAIWFYQVKYNQIRLIDYYEASGEGINHYVSKLRDKPYIYGTHYAPHDIKVTELGTGRSRLEMAASLGLRFRVVPNIPVLDGINCARSILKKCYFDKTKCKEGIRALRQYRKKYDETRRCFSDKPLHDWSSHCFVGETKVLTRYGMQQIMDLPNEGEILTLCGWKKYRNPRITQKNARLVEVAFNDGSMVRCTPDHSFLTVNGWKYAKDLQPGITIQSSLTLSRSISMVLSTGFIHLKDILPKVVIDYIEMHGEMLLGQYRKVVTFITKMITPLTTSYQISNAFQQVNTYPYHGIDINAINLNISHLTQESKLLNGINLKKADYGTKDMRSVYRVGQNGNAKKNYVNIVAKLWSLLSEKVATLKNSVAQIVNPLRIESVTNLNYTADVWCMTVPDVEHFSLHNGAIVHNCADSFRYLCVSVDEELDIKSRPLQTKAISEYISDLGYEKPNHTPRQTNYLNESWTWQ